MIFFFGFFLCVHSLQRLLAIGVSDWGGVSPVTPDHVNPEAPWPQIGQLRAVTEESGHRLAPRLAVYIYIYIYIYVYVNVYVYVYMYTHIYIYMCIRILRNYELDRRIWLSQCASIGGVYVYICLRVYINMCVYVYVYVYMDTYMYMYMYVYI